ncbi:MAG: septum formation initiator family protein [Firmicutes bacterium]|nr:septum formation initiator family protein [Bacillota bacterium]
MRIKLPVLNQSGGNLIDFPDPTTRRKKDVTRRRKSSRIKLKLGFCLSMGLLVLAVILWGPQFKHIQQMNAELAELQKQKQQLLQINAKLQEDIRQLNSDTTVERIAREKLGLVKPGEKILIEVQPPRNK